MGFLSNVKTNLNPATTINDIKAGNYGTAFLRSFNPIAFAAGQTVASKLKKNPAAVNGVQIDPSISLEELDEAVKRQRMGLMWDKLGQLEAIQGAQRLVQKHGGVQGMFNSLKNGGLVDKFQAGGQASEQDQQLNVLAQALVQLQQLGQAAEQGDQQAAAVMQEIQKRAQAMSQQSGTAMAKCGAKLKKKGEQGLKISSKGPSHTPTDGIKFPLSKKSGGCACKTHIKRVGGKLVTIDCNGNIIK